MRVWIVSVLLVALVVAGVLYATRDGGAAEGPGSGGPETTAPLPPAPLTENEIRAYMTTAPEVNAQNQRNAQEFVEIWKRTGKYPDDAATSMRFRASVEAIIQKHGHTPETFDLLQRRVEYVVNLLRWERDAPARTKDLEDKIREKEALLPGLSEAMRAQVETEIGQLKAQRDAPPPTLHDRDRELIRRYWEHLDRMVPRIGPGPSSADAPK